MVRLRFVAVMATLAALAGSFAAQSAVAADPTPEWIWSSDKPRDNERAFFRRVIELKGKPKSAAFIGSCDNGMTLFVNGESVGESNAWESPLKQDLKKYLVEGKNVIAIRGRNEGGIAALVGKITIEAEDGKKEVIVTDSNWLSSTEDKSGWQKNDFEAAGWNKPHSFGKYGREPWGAVFTGAASSGGGSVATDPSAIQTLPGFEVELLYSVPKDTEGSWVSMTTDPKGRLIVCDQYGSLYRVVPGKDAATTKVEKLNLPIGEAQGLLYAYDGLYIVVNGNAAQGSGLYKATDTNNDDQLDDLKLLKKFEGGGEHGPHAVRLGPDGKLYVVAGNFTKPPAGYDPESPHRNWAEDQLLPRNPDGGGHDPHIMAPGGWVARTDKEGKEWELICAGLRNSYDIDFNNDGELFTYDSDMEWDTGTPWYRPTRVNHIVSGGEYGWRNGTGKWPEYSPDSVGAVVNIGLGSPTGVEFGRGAKFPAKYQNALFILDWTYGKIYAVHMQPDGGSYSGTFETFVQGRPLPVTDAVVGKDGAFYFTIGGRKTQSGLYRVTYTGSEPTTAVLPEANAKAAEAREQRKKLEALHGKQDASVIEKAWPFLNSSDRSLRYAARVAIEHQDPKLWADKAFAENRSTAVIQAMVALARTGDKALQPKIVEKLNSLPFERLTEDQLLSASRAYALTFIRMGEPDKTVADSAVKRLSPLFPKQSEALNREFGALLVYLKAPAVVEPAMKLLQTAQTQEEQLYYVLILRNITNLLSDEQRRAYFSWINLAEGGYRGGNSFKKFLAKIRSDAAEKLPEADRVALKDVIEGKQKVEVVKLETTRQFVHNWQIEDLIPHAAEVESGRSFEKGRAAYEAAQCNKCHRFNGQGGDTGPDITGVGNRFNTVYLFESLIVPSKAISDQYLSTVLLTADGEVVKGRIVEENDNEIKIRTDPFAVEAVTIKKDEIDDRQLAKISEMPQGLINTLTKEEILDLIAYLRSAGNAQDKAFAK